MKLTRIRVYEAPLTSHVTYYMASGKKCDTVTSAVVRIDTDAGLTGWGEACPIPHYLPAYQKGVAPALAELAPVLIGAEFTGPEALIAAADRWLQGHPYAKSALDIALWDLLGKRTEQPLFALLGGQQSNALPLYHSISCLEPEVMAEIAAEAYARGMRQFQAKLGASGGWADDVARLAAVREAVGPEPLLYGDWNCGATSLEAIRVAQGAKPLDVMLEQPCETLEACADVRRVSGMAMKIDESGHDIASLLRGKELGCMDVVALKLSKFGGITALRRARDLCTHFGVMMVIEDTWGSDIAAAAAFHVAASTAPRYVLNVCDLAHYVWPRLAPDGPVRDGGVIAPPTGLGLGVTPDLSVLGDAVLDLD